MLLANEFEFGGVLGAAAGNGTHCDATLQIGDFGGEVAGFERDFGGAAAHANSQSAMFTGSQGSAAGFQFEGDEDDDEGLHGFLAADHLNLRGAGIEVRRGKNGEIGGRGCEDEARFVVEGDAVGVGDAAEAVPADFNAIAEGSKARNGADLQRGGGRIRGGNNGAGDTARTALDGSVELFDVQWSDKEGAAGGIGGELIAVGEFHGDAGSKAATDIEDREGGAFAADEFAGEKKDTRGGSGRRLLSRSNRAERRQKKESKENSGKNGKVRHNEIVVENGPGQKCGKRERREQKEPCSRSGF